nr:TIR domain-containing protein [Bradyrhizobium sp. 186]
MRNSWVIRERGDAPRFYDAAEFEQAQKRLGGIKNWIDDQFQNTSVTAVLAPRLGTGRG